MILRNDDVAHRHARVTICLIKAGFPVGTLDLEADRDGNLWVGLMYQGGVAKLDRKTGTVQTWSVQKEWQTDATQQSFVSPTFSHVDGKVWMKNSDRAQILRLEPATGHLGEFPHVHRPGDEANHRLLRDQRRPQQQSVLARDARTGGTPCTQAPGAD